MHVIVAVHAGGMWDDYAGLPPFRRCDAAEHGLTDADVRRLVSKGVLVRLAHGLLTGYRRVELAVETPQQLALRAQAMQRRYPGSVVGRQSAALLHGFWLVGGAGPVRLLRECGYPRSRYDVMVETATLPADHLIVVEGVDATTPARTAADLITRRGVQRESRQGSVAGRCSVAERTRVDLSMGLSARAPAGSRAVGPARGWRRPVLPGRLRGA